ncbi:MAG: hypothetical protein JST68_20515 [Bacteroidetes bacterium]|nr:hypothetical protein [Bacteroidota bacterium]
MIQLLATKYRKSIAYVLFLLFEASFCLSARAGTARWRAGERRNYAPLYYGKGGFKPLAAPGRGVAPVGAAGKDVKTMKAAMPVKAIAPAKVDSSATPATVKKVAIGGPNQPEMTSFKSVGINNMVNLFTGDFSYNIPLLDVGGYPVNIFYNGEIGPETEASWVGLGWNINPGNINRNMRGVPDDFNGEEMLRQEQNMKPNVTVGVGLAADAELLGIKWLPPSFTINTGVSFNNYLGIALDLGVKGGVEFKVAGKSGSEKSTSLSLGLNLAGDLNSRSGLTLSPSVSLIGSSFMNDRTFNLGASLSTSYNSRVGIKALQITDQLSVSKISTKYSFHGSTFNFSKIHSQNSATLFSTSISFAKPSYIPSIRVPLVNKTFAGHFQLGGGILGAYGSGEIEVYKQTSVIDPGKIVQNKPMVGYLYAENAMNDPNKVMDFTRLNDREVTPNTPVISAPQYSYDVFTIQGEGTGGSIRAYRNDPGYIRDNSTGTTDSDDGIGADIGPPGHYGGNFNMIRTPSAIGEWISGNLMRTSVPFQAPQSNTSWENVYFRNPGESSVLDPHEYDAIGGLDLSRFHLSGDSRNPGIANQLDNFSHTSSFTNNSTPAPRAVNIGRKKRTQMVDFLTAADASCYGLDKSIKSYDGQTIFDAVTHNLTTPLSIPRWTETGYRRRNHISEINVTEGDGKRYIYGIPVYNVTQKDFTFTSMLSDNISLDDDQVHYNANEASPSQTPAISSGTRDGYAQVVTTPAYAHSFLLSGLLSPDYVDVTGDGITDDDLGDAVKFNYSMMADNHKWRTPFEAGQANFNPGNRTNKKDDKGLVSYGERESWFMHSIESKTMIAIFYLDDDRHDGQSVMDEYGNVPTTANLSLRKLKQIRLYNKADLKRNGYSKAKPIKTVDFSYDYSLCSNAPDHKAGADPLGTGRLTLTGITFSYNGQVNRTNKDKYVFSYGSGTGNPGYERNASDRWGTYKPKSMNPAGMTNGQFPYTPQQASAKTTLDQNAGAWSLKKILLPSGGQIEVTYESDDYAFVQNKRAMDMMSIAGFGSTSGAFSNSLYPVSTSASSENMYLFVNIPGPCAEQDVYPKYLAGVDQLAVRMLVNMPAGTEYVTSYASFDPAPGNYGLYGGHDDIIWIKLKTVNGRSPLSLSALEYLREQLPGQAFPGYDVSQDGALDAIGDALVGMIDAVASAFSDPISHLRSKGLAKSVALDHSFVRLNDPDGYKYGGGQRVKSIKLKDNWDVMTKKPDGTSSSYTTVYDQEYCYTTTETFNGATRTISSGVASYEPSIGGEENPFQTIIQVADKLPLGPTSYGAVEMPVLDALFPTPVVGYSKVTVTSLPSNLPNSQQKTRSGIGRQVTEFYTAKDYPVFYSNTALDGTTNLVAHDASTTNFFSKYAFDSRTISQGFLIATNDMHGKMHSQTSYAENDPTLKVSYTENYYRNTGINGLDEKFDFVSSSGGTITSGNLGIDVELMTDTREFNVSSSSIEVQAQVDLFPVFLPFWIPFIWPVSGTSHNIYRAITTTKVVNFHSVLDSVMVMDKGSRVGTKNLLYDAETGQVIVTRTNNEFDKPIYKTNYPAWWAYSGMALAYKNTGVSFTSTPSVPLSISDGRLTSGSVDLNLLESGDELFYTGDNPSSPGCPPASLPTGRIWVLDKNKVNPPFPAGTRDLMFIDSVGQPYTNTQIGKLRVIRSGHRNMLDAMVASATSLVSPIVDNGTTRVLSLVNTSKVLAATALEFNEKWQIDKGVIGTYRMDYNSANCTYTEVPDCNGYLDKHINPYQKGVLGNFRGYRTLTFYDNRMGTTDPSKPIDPTVSTNLMENGFLLGFTPYWDFDGPNSLVPNTTLTNWIESNRVTRMNSRGLELETKNANNIYTSAQYGYRKSLPLAITNNSPAYQSVYEGFEDNGFDQGLDNDHVVNCPKDNKVDWLGMANTGLVNTDTTDFNAHTGKYVLAVTKGQTASVNVPVVTTDNTSFSLPFGSNTSKVLNNPGITGSVYADPDLPNTFFQEHTVSYSNIGGHNVVKAHVPMFFSSDPPTNSEREGKFTWDSWTQIPSAGFYDFSANIRVQFNLGGENNGEYFVGNIVVTLTDQNNNTYVVGGNEYSVDLDITTPGIVDYPDAHPPHIFLCPGFYQLHATGYAFTRAKDLNGTAEADLTWECDNALLPLYIDLSTENGCTTTTAIPGDASMFNPGFNLPAGKKMLLSTWVREEQSGSSGFTNTGIPYTHNQILFSDGVQSDVVLKPEGPVIEGWQRYEGPFTPSPGITSGTFKFVNNNPSQKLYIDDIRIHPFNAEMKSYVYDPVSLRLVAELDNNNYAAFYEYDEEGTLIRTKAETQKGIKTIKESRSAKQKTITTVQ